MIVKDIERLIRKVRQISKQELINGNIERSKWLKAKRIELIIKLKSYKDGCAYAYDRRRN